MKKYTLIITALILQACGYSENIVTKEVAGPTVEVPVQVPVEVPVDRKNVTCKVYDITGLGFSTVPDIASLNIAPLGTVKVGTINNPTTNDTEVFPMLVGSSLEATKINFAMECAAKLIVPLDGTYQFSLTSDDGSLLYLGGRKLIDNDGAHGNVTKTANVTLVKGTHNMRVTYYEGAGPKALMLQWKLPGGVLTNLDDADFAQ